jgi:hypothetical protein
MNGIHWLTNILPSDQKSEDRETEIPETAPATVSETKRNFFISEKNLKRWCTEGYDDPKTGKRVYGKDLLLSFFFAREGFWTRLEQYARSLDPETVQAIGGRIPFTKKGFHFRMQRAGFERLSPKNLCLWLGALDADRAELCEESGLISEKGLRRWCHEGYEDPRTGVRIFGKDVLRNAYAAADFWNELRTYSETLTAYEVVAIGGKIPFDQFSFARRMGKESGSVTIPEIFSWLEIGDPPKERTVSGSWGYLSGSGLQRWCHEGYEDPETGVRIYGEDVLLDAFYSGSFWGSLERYVLSLSDEAIKAIGGKIPLHLSGYVRHIREAGLTESSVRGVCLWFGVLDPVTAEFSNANGWISEKGVRRWCHEGYRDSRTGVRVLGKDVLIRCALSPEGFGGNIQRYFQNLSNADIRNIGGGFPLHHSGLSYSIGIRRSASVRKIFERLGIWEEFADRSYRPSEDSKAVIESMIRKPQTLKTLADEVKTQAKIAVNAILSIANEKEK